MLSSEDISPNEKHFVESLGDFYAVIVAIEKLEKANDRDLVRSEHYLVALRRLLGRYHSILAQIQSGNSLFVSETAFWETHGSRCVAARRRVQKGHPSDIEQEAAAAASAEASRRSGVDPKTVAEAVQHFITLMDCLKLQQTAVDQLFPILNDVVSTLKKITEKTQTEFEFLSKLDSWVKRLEKMHPSDELNERDTREFAFDIERAYGAFYSTLGNRV